MEKLALIIKKNDQLLKIIGGSLFVVTLILGIFWLVKSDNPKFEPLIFILECLFSLIFALPNIATMILPDRKPVRDMSIDEIIEFILTTSKDDWQGNQTFEIDEYFLKEDHRLRIVCHDPDDRHNLDFHEPWANSLINPDASSNYYRILYDGNFIRKIILVFVDGNRVSLPLPNLQDMSVDKFDYKIAQIYNNQNTLNNYMNRLGFHVRI